MPPQADLPIREGDIIAGKYTVERVLGRGGMGFVLAARHRDLGHLVAIKMLLPHLVNHRGMAERFLGEARAAVNLRSEHTVRVADVGLHQSRGSTASSPEAVPYLVMEYLEGQSLGALVRKGPLPIRDAALFIIQACDALEEAHRAGIVHRDLKPDNLFLTTRPNGAPLVKVLDFGISRVPFGDDEDRRLTGTTDVMGTPHYMAPEQAAAARNADARSDVWALGVTLYELLTGRLPFGGSNVAEIITRVLSTVPPAPRTLRPEIPAELESLVMSCLEKAPERRCPSAAELARALTPFAPGGSWAEVPPTPPLPAMEEAATLHRVGFPAAPRPDAVVAPSGGTVPAAPLGVSLAGMPTGGLGSVTLDATTRVMRRKRTWGVIALGSGTLAITALALLGWWHRDANHAAQAAAPSGGDPTVTGIAANQAALTAASSSSAPSSAAAPGANEPAMGSGTSAIAPPSPSADASGPATTSARPAASKGHVTGTSGLKKTRK